MRRATLVLGLLAGCEGFWDTDEPPFPVDTGDTADTADTDDTGDASGCPAGLAPGTAEVRVANLFLNTLQTLAVSGTEPYDGMPAVCVNDDGTSVQALLTVGGAPFAWVRSEAGAAANQPLTASPPVTFDAFGYDPPVTFGPAAWYQGQYTVAVDTGRVIHTINGNAEADSVQLSTFLEITVTP